MTGTVADDGQILSCDLTPQGKQRRIFTLRQPLTVRPSPSSSDFVPIDTQSPGAAVTLLAESPASVTSSFAPASFSKPSRPMSRITSIRSFSPSSVMTASKSSVR